jgi:hypothetical protein
MPTRTDESPPRQQDRVPERGRRPLDEVSSFEPEAVPERRTDDGPVALTDDPDINTHGSER